MDPRIPDSLQREWAARDARTAKLTEQMRQHCADALIRIGEAIKHPSISRMDMEAASLSITKAMSIACALDPEDEAA